MIVTTIDLLNYLRCRRYAALDTRMQARQFNGLLIDEKFSSLKYLSVTSGYQSLSEADDPDDAVLQKQMHHEVTAKAVYQIRQAAEPKIQSLKPDMLLSKSQRMSFEFAPEVTLSIRIDFLGSYSDSLAAFTVLPISDRDLVNWKYNVGKDRVSFFSNNEQNVYFHQRAKVSPTLRSNYEERLAKMTDRHTEIGKYVFDLAFKVFVLKKMYPNQTIRSALVLLNHSFVLGSEAPEIPDPAAISVFDMTPVVERAVDVIEVDLYRMLNHIRLNDDSPCLLVKNECQRNSSFECQFAEYCFGHVPKTNSVFAYLQSHLGFCEGPIKTDICHDTYELLNEGMVDMLDVPISWLQREKNLMQRYCVENEYTFINKAKVKAMLETLRYPLYYLDFEAYPAILPRFRGESPYSQSVFQFSLFVQNERGKLDPDDPAAHFEFLAEDAGDHREDLIHSLLSAIPPGTTPIIVYNQTFEKNRLEELAAIFPEYAPRLHELASRLFDLLKVLKTDYDFFVSRGFSKESADSFNFYDPRMSGSYSLKKVLPVFDPNGYESLAIANGMTAYLQYARFPEMEPAERQETVKNLLAYCRQDTWSMFVILHGLENMI